MSPDVMFQVFLFVMGGGGFLLVSRQDKWSIYGYWMGLVVQPCWLYLTYTTQAWGIMALVPLYFYGNLQGIRKFHEV